MYQSKMDKFTIDFKDKSQMCAFNCGANWGDDIINPCCYACMLGYGLNFPKEEIKKNIPYLEPYWEKKMQNKLATETKLETTEAELYKTQAALKSSESENALLKLELEKFKLKAAEVELQLQKKESTLKSVVADTKLQTEIQDVWHSFTKMKATINNNVV